MTGLAITTEAGGPLRQVWAILSPPERRQLLLLTPAVIIMAVLETVGVASIVPFLGLLSDPGIVERNPWLSAAYSLGGFATRNGFFFAVGVAVLLLVTFSNVVSSLTTWGLLRFSWMRNHSLSTRLLDAYLSRPYEFFLDKNSAELSKNILGEVQAAVSGVIVTGVQLVARLCVVAGVAVALMLIDTLMATAVVVVFGGVYGGLYAAIRRQVTQSGALRLEVNKARHKTAQESLAGVKELKLYGLESVAVGQFSTASRIFAERQASIAVISQIPRYALETIAFGGVLLIVLYLLHAGRRLEDTLPVLGLYAFAAYRLLPALQTVFGAVTSLRFNLGALELLRRDLTPSPSSHRAGPEAVPFLHHIKMEGLGFSYHGSTRATLRGIGLTIPAGQWLALVGPTGAGKSTLVDVLLGLLVPQQGSITIDNRALVGDGDRLAWQRNVAYVPQQIFLLDDSILKNIAFGVPSTEIDRERAIEAARIAQVDNVIASLPAGLETVVGERGIRLSGGQRQRIGIARALYRRPALLVLDEATSALDNATEARFFAELKRRLTGVTVLSIAHRLSTTRSFDRIVVLEQGTIVESGTYTELKTSNSHFQNVEA